MSREPRVSLTQAWREMVIAGIRSRFGVAALAVMAVLAVWNFARGSIGIGCACLAIIAFVYLRLPWAVALAIAARRHRQA